jgi:hypothetical protein
MMYDWFFGDRRLSEGECSRSEGEKKCGGESHYSSIVTGAGKDAMQEVSPSPYLSCKVLKTNNLSPDFALTRYTFHALR